MERDRTVIETLNELVARRPRWGFWKLYDRLRLDGQCDHDLNRPSVRAFSAKRQAAVSPWHARPLVGPPGLRSGARNCTEQPDQNAKNAKVRWSFRADSVQ